MKYFYKITLIILIIFGLTRCEKREQISTELEVQNFVWKGLNAYYLWQEDVPDLQDNRFSNQNALNDYISTQQPEELFENLLYKRDEIDKWSWIVTDYVALEQLFAGVRKSNGMQFGLVAISENEQQIFGYVRYVIPNSEAASLGIHRGDILYGINGQQLTRNNYQDLLSSESYTVNFGTFSIANSTPNITPNDVNIELNKEVLNINPIQLVTTYEENNHKIGYILYNQFVSNYDEQLNDAFLQLKNEGIKDLVLDLRYNGGGSVQTAVNLVSMITGQYTNELFAKEKWNSKWQSYLEANHPEYLTNNFTDKLSNGTAINSLNLDEITILVTGNSASASELVINGLNPYITVNLIGTTTHGKYVGSVTLYDSDSYRKDDNTLNTNHHYAMQPIVLEMVNKLGENEKNGFAPTSYLPEDFANLGILGDPNEPLFRMAIDQILGLRRPVLSKNQQLNFKPISDDGLNNPFLSNMYVDLK